MQNIPSQKSYLWSRAEQQKTNSLTTHEHLLSSTLCIVALVQIQYVAYIGPYEALLVPKYIDTIFIIGRRCRTHLEGCQILPSPARCSSLTALEYYQNPMVHNCRHYLWNFTGPSPCFPYSKQQSCGRDLGTRLWLHYQEWSSCLNKMQSFLPLSINYIMPTWTPCFSVLQMKFKLL